MQAGGHAAMIELRAESVRYYSQQDEDSFFYRLKALPEVRDIYGSGRCLYIKCDTSLADDSLRELVAIFFRYHVDTAQLDVFATNENKHWFMNPGSYWRG